jgi:hypothetical protein
MQIIWYDSTKNKCCERQKMVKSGDNMTKWRILNWVGERHRMGNGGIGGNGE